MEIISAGSGGLLQVGPLGSAGAGVRPYIHWKPLSSWQSGAERNLLTSECVTQIITVIITSSSCSFPMQEIQSQIERVIENKYRIMRHRKVTSRIILRVFLLMTFKGNGEQETLDPQP